MVESNNNLRISGAGSSGGGIYNEVRISGAGEIKGDIKCNLFKTSGASDINGNVEADIVETSGASDIRGNLKAKSVRVSGSSDIRGDVETEMIEISGSSDIKGNLTCKEVKISGACDIDGNCEAEKFFARGGFDIGGLLNAEEIKIFVGGKCRVREIGGTNIEIRILSKDDGAIMKLIKSIFTNSYRRLETSIIEGDNIYLENTIARVVRGNKVEIGPNCSIESVEYMDDIKVSTDSEVKEQKKVI